MSPQDPNRAVHAEIRGFLGDRSLRGDALCRSLSDLGARHRIEPFRVAMHHLLGLDLPEARARGTVRLIEEHRDALSATLGTDPGFEVAAFDYLHEIEGRLREPVFRTGPAVLPPDRAGRAEEDLPTAESVRMEARRVSRGGRPFALVSLAPDPGSPVDLKMRADWVMREAARDTDQACGTADDMTLLLPCTGLEEARIAADRYRRVLADSTGVPWSAGVVSSASEPEGAGLEDSARAALRTARSAGGDRTAATRPDRRAHGRRPCGGAVSARFLEGGAGAEVGIENLSLGGALVATAAPLKPGERIVLGLRGTMARSREVVLPARVGRTLGRPGTPASWRSAVAFPADPGHRVRVAGLLSDL